MSFVAQNAIAITPADGANLAVPVNRITAVGAGTLRVTTSHNGDQTFAVYAGQTLELRVLKVWATGTTATGLAGFW